MFEQYTIGQRYRVGNDIVRVIAYNHDCRGFTLNGNNTCSCPQCLGRFVYMLNGSEEMQCGHMGEHNTYKCVAELANTRW